MWRIALKNLLSHKRRLIGTASAVVLGVAFLAGTLVLTDTMRAAFDDPLIQQLRQESWQHLISPAIHAPVRHKDGEHAVSKANVHQLCTSSYTCHSTPKYTDKIQTAEWVGLSISPTL